jgi:hypothetical protein
MEGDLGQVTPTRTECRRSRRSMRPAFLSVRKRALQYQLEASDSAVRGFMESAEASVPAEGVLVDGPKVWLDLGAPDRVPRQEQYGRAATTRRPRLRPRLPTAPLSLRSVLHR